MPSCQRCSRRRPISCELRCGTATNANCCNNLFKQQLQGYASVEGRKRLNTIDKLQNIIRTLPGTIRKRPNSTKLVEMRKPLTAARSRAESNSTRQTYAAAAWLRLCAILPLALMSTDRQKDASMVGQRTMGRTWR